MEQKQKFPTEIVDLPSQGKLYPKESPLASGTIEMKYMTAKEEDILTNQNLILSILHYLLQKELLLLKFLLMEMKLKLTKKLKV